MLEMVILSFTCIMLIKLPDMRRDKIENVSKFTATSARLLSARLLDMWFRQYCSQMKRAGDRKDIL